MTTQQIGLVISAQDRTAAGLGSVRAGLERLGSAASSLAGNFAAITGAFAAGSALVGFVQRLNAPLLAMKDLSEATGAAFDNISGLENVARNAGASFDVVGAALVRFNQQLNTADTAASPISQALRRIGLDAAALRQQDPALALQTVAQALSRYADDGEKARLVQELFGKSVREVAPFLRDLAEAGKLNATVTAEQAEAADQLDKQLARLRTNAEDAGRAIAGAFVPSLNRIADAIRSGNIISGLSQLGAEINAAVAASVGLDPFSVLGRRIAGVTDEIAGLQARLNGPGNLSAQLRTALEGSLQAKVEELKRLEATVAAGLRRSGGSLAGLPLAEFSNEGRPRTIGAAPPPRPTGTPTAQRTTLTPEQATLVEALRRLEQTDQAKLTSLRAQLQALVGLVQQGGTVEGSVFAGIADELARLDPAARAAADRLDRINQLLADTPTARMEKATGDIKLLIDAVADAKTEEAFARLNEALQQTFDKLGELPALAEPVAEEMSDFARQAARNIQDALGDSLEAALSGNFRSIGRLWLQTIQRMAAQAAAARLNELIFGSIGQKGGSLGEWGQAIVNFFKPRAMGGPVTSGQGYLVGERGPELFVPRASGTIVPNGAMGAMGGMTYSPTVVIQGDVGPATVALVEQALARERRRMARMAYAGGA